MIFKRIKDSLIFISLLFVFLTLIVRLFGIETYVVKSDSMANKLRVNDFIYIMKYKNPSIDDLKEGEIISFTLGNTLVIHRIVDITDDVITTKGDNNSVNDDPISINQVHGRYLFKLPFFGLILNPLTIIVIAALIGVYKLGQMLYKELKHKES
ncbi:MAG: signal peptidase I [Acholeplasmataceae bacterium]